MNISNAIPSTVKSVSFSFLSSEDIRRISVKQLTNPVLLDDLNRPNRGGLYDPALGPSDRRDICATCRLNYFTCPGHYGHIDLPSPVYHPLFMGVMFKILRAACMYCHRFRMSRVTLFRFIAKLRLLDHGLVRDAADVDNLQIENANVEQKETKKLDVDQGEDVQEDQAAENQERLIGMINLFVGFCLNRLKERTRDSYKDSIVYQARKEVMAEFLKEAASIKRCRNERCRAYAHSLKKEGHTKIIELDLSAKQKLQHEMMGLKRATLLFEPRREARKKPRMASSDDEEDDDEEEEEEEDGDDLQGDAGFTDEDEELDTPKTNQLEALPKSASGKVKTMRGRNERIMPPEECRSHLRRLFENVGGEFEICSLMFGRHGRHASYNCEGLSPAYADMFFLECLLVSPTRFRPPAKMGEQLFEHPHNELLAKVLNTTYNLRDQNAELVKAQAKDSSVDEAGKRRLLSRLLETLVQLQVDVNSFIDSSKNPTRPGQGKQVTPGVKQNLEKKEGLFRMHMMGKRVNYAARSVISPDVNIDTNEIGIPPVFARKLTFPEPVTAHNIHLMRQLVINGPSKYPGASFVETEDRKLLDLSKMSEDKRIALANQLYTPQNDINLSKRTGMTTRTQSLNKKVYRHLRNGDALILNRQPTLHKPSMMVHKARVLQGEKTIRMHYANCNSYNADFDGDEMNIHFPQNELARSEAMMLANTDNQYLVPTSGKPLRGLIQDHVVAGVWMTSRGAFFTREEYFQLLYGALRPEEDLQNSRLRTLPPTIWKPRPLWTGKQIISTILFNITPSSASGINLTSKAKVNGDLWQRGSEEGKVIFVEGELVCGVLDKSQFGASDYGLVHTVYELYGADVAGKLLGILSRLFTKFLQHRAFTCRMDDLTLTGEGDSRRRDILESGKNLGHEGSIENFPSLENVPIAEKEKGLVSLLQDVLRDDSKMAGLDVTVKKKLARLTKSIADACMPHGLFRKFPDNHMQMMTQSGAKGSAVNAQQISCALGQQELEGRRVPVMVSGKTLPAFKAFETAAMAGGYIASRFLTGVKPQEFYFHCMAGREGLIDTAVKTSRSGYLQRCLIKHLEGIRVHYDNTVRGSDSSVYQFQYGGDGLDVTRQKHLLQLPFLAQNEDSILARLQPQRLASIDDITDREASSHMKHNLKRLSGKSTKRPLDPTMSLFNPSRCLGSTSEAFAQKIANYIDENMDNLIESKTKDRPMWKSNKPAVPRKKFQLMMNMKYLRSMVDPGEAVGLLASQGVGEPSTQMTLNTFHFAGHGAANVTLGIPRLREIVMTASEKPKTPSMSLRVRPGVSEKHITSFCKRASKVSLAQIVDRVEVRERLTKHRRRKLAVDIYFYPGSEYQEEYEVDESEICASFNTKFPQILRKLIQLEFKKLKANLKSQMSDVGHGKAEAQKKGTDGPGEEEEDGVEVERKGGDDGSEAGDGDADDEKRARQTKEQTTYDTDEEEEDIINTEYDEAAFEDEIEGRGAYSRPDDAMDVDEEIEARKKADKSKLDEITMNFISNLKIATKFEYADDKVHFELEFGADEPKLLLVGLIEEACKKTIVRQIDGISEVFYTKDDGKDRTPKLVTNGANFKGFWSFILNDCERGSDGEGEPVVEINDIQSNDIFRGLKTYGVEMARALILKEVQGVFAAYNIDVDIRHLELIADYMTFDGGYKPFNRKGISTNSSPLLKASYEMTASFISEATLHGDFDDLNTPSGNIVVGQPSHSGTGAFDIVQDLRSPHNSANMSS